MTHKMRLVCFPWLESPLGSTSDLGFGASTAEELPSPPDLACAGSWGSAAVMVFCALEAKSAMVWCAESGEHEIAMTSRHATPAIAIRRAFKFILLNHRMP